MNYELAKRLKEAGFPQSTEHYWCTDTGERTFSRDCKPYEKVTCGEHMALPTLSELIARFERGKFICLGPKKEVSGVIWEAWGYVDGSTLFTGESPEEAVASLWLALNEKEDGNLPRALSNK